jgi:hypothetical protein
MPRGSAGGLGWRRRSCVCPKGADSQWGKDPLEQLMVGFDSWRAAGPGNGAGRNPATKSTYGGRAIWQAVTRVKLEQASKAAMWTPTRRKTGESGTNREEPGAGARHCSNHYAPIRSTGVVSTACQKGNRASVGEARDGRGVANRERCQKGRRTIWASERARGTDEAG